MCMTHVNEIELEVFRVGDYGDKGAFSEDDLDRIAADYDPAVHEAPVTIDHQQAGTAADCFKVLICLANCINNMLAHKPFFRQHDLVNAVDACVAKVAD